MAPGLGGRKAALRALLASAWLFALFGCPGGDDDSEVDPVASAAGKGAADATCRGKCKPCDFDSDCDQGRGLGGYACMHPEKQNSQVTGQDTTPIDEGRRFPVSSSSAEDAGADQDAGPVTDPLRMAPKAQGVCSTECDSRLCIDPGKVCTAPNGYCDEGCDDLRPNCPGDLVCDFSSRKKACFDLTGQCRTVSDCPVFDEQLVSPRAYPRGVVSCEAERCRYTPTTFGLNSPVQSTLVLDALPELQVNSPQPGARILPSEMSSFTFEFAVPAQVIVAAILTREPTSLDDGASAAVWTAYLDAKQARNGVTLADGGAMMNGKWQRHTDGNAMLPLEVQLYFLAIAYDRGERIAQSKLVPFSVGARRPKEGDACSGKDGEFCAKDSALLCRENVCLRPCLSNDDCADGLLCSEPNWLGARAARVCR